MTRPRSSCGTSPIILSTILSCLVSATATAADAPTPTSVPIDKSRELTFLTWSDYLDESVASEFEKRFGAKLRRVYFQTDEDRDIILAASNAQGYDVVMLNTTKLALYGRKDWIAPLDDEALPNLGHLHTRWRAQDPDARRYGVPYFWGTLGIGYRKDLVPSPLDSWRALIEPAPELHQRILMIRDGRDMMGSALKMLGHSINSSVREELVAAGAALTRQKPHVRVYGYMSLTKENVLVRGDVWAAMMYSGDALVLQQFNPDIDYVVPKEGCTIWTDYLAVMRSSGRREIAHQFINFLNEPEVAARNARFVSYATPNKAAEAHLPAGYFANPVRYPPEDVLARCEVEQRLAPRSSKLVNEITQGLVH